MPSKSSLLFLFQTGYHLVSLPLTLFNLATTTYYLLVVKMPFLLVLFPDFGVYLVAGALLGVPSIIFIGMIYVKSSWFKAPAKNNPYSYIILPNSIPLYQAVSDLCKKNGLEEDAKILDEIIKVSEKERSIHA